MKVVILWMNKDSDCTNGLVWNGGAGPLRVYEKDRYDPRAGEDLAFFDAPKDALAWMLANPGKPTQVSLKCAASLGWEKRDFGEVSDAAVL